MSAPAVRERMLLSLLLLGVLGYQSLLLALDRVPPIHDEQALSRQSQALANAVFRRDEAPHFAWNAAQAPYPPLLHVTALPVTLWRRHSLTAPRWSLLLYTLILLIAVFALGRRLGDERTGFFAAAFAALMPGLSGFSRIYLVDFPLAALTAACLAALAATREFTRRRPAILLGVLLGLGLLTKPSLPFYVGPPLFVYLFVSLAAPSEKAGKRGVWLNVLIAGAVGLGLGLPWYLTGWSAFFTQRLDIETFRRLASFPEPRPVLYLTRLWETTMGPALCLATAAAVFLARKNRVYLILAAATLPPFFLAVYGLGAVSGRYMLPLLPAAAVWIALGLDRLRARARWLPLAVALASLAWFSWFSFAQNAGPLSDAEQHARFQERGLLRPQYLAPDAERVSRSLARHGISDRVLLLYNAPLTETVQTLCWERNPAAAVLNLFESASLGQVSEMYDEPAEIRRLLHESRAIVAARGAPDDADAYSPDRNVPADYAVMVFRLFDEEKENLALADEWEAAGGRRLQIWINASRR